MHNTPFIFDISKGRLDDGNGIRTVIFLKGCPLKCKWCHNPESQSFSHEFMWDNAKCLKCGDCVNSCPDGSIKFNAGDLYINTSQCGGCGKCVNVCPSEALRSVGKSYNIDEITAAALSDKLFYDVSGGGITFSGGEPLCFPEYVGEISSVLKSKGISSAIETCGYFDYEKFRRFVLPYIDCVMYDIKLICEKEHIKYTGQSNKIILENFERLARENIRVIPRTPLIPGITDSTENITGIKRFLEKFGIVSNHILLPYNSVGEKKYEQLIINHKI